MIEFLFPVSNFKYMVERSDSLTRNPQLATRNAQPATRNATPATRHPQPIYFIFNFLLKSAMCRAG